MERSPKKVSGDLSGVVMRKPRRRGSLKLSILAFIAVLLLCASGFWLTRTAPEKEDLKAQASARLGEILGGTPLAGLADFLKPAPEPLPARVISPVTTPGTLAGREIVSTIAAPLDPDSPLMPRQGDEPGQAGTGAGVLFDQEPLAQVTEDARIRSGYVSGLAKWLANRYRPGSQGGNLNASIQALNQECGGKLASYAEGGRSGLLRYAFHPAMIQGLYNLYVPHFMADLNEAARGRGMTESQNRQFHLSVAGSAALLASCLDGIQRLPGLSGKLRQIDNLAQKAVDANADLATAVFELDGLREARAPAQRINAAQMRVDGATARYTRATAEHDRAQTALASEIRKYSGQNLDEDSLLFLAAWVARRYAGGEQARSAISACITVLRDLSARCSKASEAI